MAEHILQLPEPRELPAHAAACVRIEAFTGAHARDFAELIVDPSLASIPVGRAARQRGPGACVDRMLAAMRRGHAHWFAVIDGAAGFVGQVGLANLYGDQAQLTYWIGRPYRSAGRATAAARQAMAYAFERAGIGRLTTLVAEDNLASRRVLDRLGFIRAPALDPRPSVLCFTAANLRPSPATRFVRMLKGRG